MSQCIISALKAEAEPIINYYNLEKNFDYDYPVYNKGDLTIICTGVGRENVRKVLSDYYSKMLESKNYQFINIGIAGGKKGECKIGQCFVIEKVFDDKSEIVYGLNNVFESQYSSNHITTVSEPILDGGDKYHLLVDMEAHEICSVIGELDHLNNLVIIKIISDYMDLSKKYFNSKKVKDLLEINLLQIDTMLNELRKHQ